LETESTSLIECDGNFDQNYPNPSVILIFSQFSDIKHNYSSTP
jgi:hypothetical protein